MNAPSRVCKSKRDEETDTANVASTKSTKIRYHVSILIAALLIIALSGWLQLKPSEGINMPFWGTLPGICTWKNFLGIDCPGCGLTRCFVEIAHGNWKRAWQYNPAGFLIFGLVIYQIPFRGIQLWRLWGGEQDLRHSVYLINFAAWGIVVSLLAQWIVKHLM